MNFKSASFGSNADTIPRLPSARFSESFQLTRNSGMRTPTCESIVWTWRLYIPRVSPNHSPTLPLPLLDWKTPCPCHQARLNHRRWVEKCSSLSAAFCDRTNTFIRMPSTLTSRCLIWLYRSVVVFIHFTFSWQGELISLAKQNCEKSLWRGVYFLQFFTE